MEKEEATEEEREGEVIWSEREKKRKREEDSKEGKDKGIAKKEEKIWNAHRLND